MIGDETKQQFPAALEVNPDAARLDGNRTEIGLRVLIVEDDADLAGLLKETFQTRGYRADIAATVREAREMALRSACDVAVLEYDLPDGRGDSLLDVLRECRPDCVCLMLTGDPAAEPDCMKKGAAACLRKPFVPEFLIELCERARRERSLLRAQSLLEARTGELRERELRYRTLLQTAMDGYWLVDTHGCIREVNETYCRMSGYSEQELLAMRVADLECNETQDDVVAHIRRIIDQGQVRFETRHRRRDGSVFDVEVSVQYRSAEGNRCVVFLRDITQRRQWEEALSREKRFVEAMLESIPGYVYVYDDQGRLVRWNKKHEEMTGYSAEELSQMTLEKWFEGEDARKVAAAVEDVLKTGYGEVEACLKVKDGRKLRIHSNGVRLTLDGKTYFTGVGTDITERKETEEALRKSEGILRALVHTIPDLVWLKDTDGVYLACNPMFERFFGAREKDIIGKTDYDFVDRELAELFRGNDCKAMAAGKPTCNEEWITFADDGRQALLETIKTPMHDESGVLIGVLGIGRDITERKRAEDALKINQEALYRQNELFASLLKNLPIGVFMVEVPSGMPLVANEAAVDLLGRGILPDASLSTLSEVYHACKRGSRDPYPVDEMPIVLGMRGEKSHVDDMVVKRPDGTEVLLEVFGSPVADSQGAIWASLASFFDITERTQAEMEKSRLQAQLQQAQKLESLGQLAGGVAHDFNNMLSVILGHAEIALMKQETAQQLHKHLEEIKKAAIRSADLTRQLLAFARKQTISPTVMDINETVEGMLKMLRRLIGEDIHLVWRPEAHPWPVKVDPSQIDQILANLCVNARDAIRGVGTVTIETGNRTFSEDDCVHLADTKPGEYVMFAVSDTGCGMDRKLLASIFEPFFTTKEMGQGTGLGLSTVYGIVKQNSGFINVYSEPGQGTTFTIFLPRCESGAAANETVVSEAVRRGHETILVVEDQPEILTVCTLFLRDIGYTVLIADGPLQAIRLADEHPGEIHLLLTDVIMPEMNGRDLAGKLTAVHPNLKRLFMSGYTANVIACHGVLEEGENFIQKPFSMKDLAGRLRTVLDGH